MILRKIGQRVVSLRRHQAASSKGPGISIHVPLGDYGTLQYYWYSGTFVCVWDDDPHLPAQYEADRWGVDVGEAPPEDDAHMRPTLPPMQGMPASTDYAYG